MAGLISDIAVTLTSPTNTIWQEVEHELGGVHTSYRWRAIYATTGDPDSSSDVTFFFAVGSVWINTSAGRYWVALDVSDGAAVWQRLHPYDADLAAIAALSSDGLIARTGSGTAAARTMTASAPLSLANGDGVAGAPAFSISDGAIALAKLANIGRRSVLGNTGNADGVPAAIPIGRGLSIKNSRLRANWSPDVYARNVVTAQAWTTRTPATTNGWNGVCWSPDLGLFVAVGGSGTGNRVMTSPDGVTWTSRTSAADNTWLSVCWSPELSLFVAVGSSGTGNRIMTSPDGITWTSRTNPEDNSWWRVCWSPELTLFVAVAASGTNRVMTSPDGVTWTARSAAAANQWVNVCWSPELGLFVAVAITGTGNRVMTSPDGITWTSRTSPADNDWRGLCWSPELSLFVAVAVSGTGNRVMTSPDGITWTLRTSPADNDWRGLCWSPALGLFVAIAGSGTGNRVMTSPDGITWTLRASAADRSWQSVCWSPELETFCSVASGGTSTDVQCVSSRSGLYTPTLTNETNLAASTAYLTRWFRVADMIHIFGRVNVDPTTTGQTQLGMSLPVASAFAAEEHCGGNATSKAVAGFGAAIYADATNDRARFEWIAVDTASRDLNFSFSYRIVA